MSLGVPVVATTAGALPEILGSAALLVPPADVDSLAQAMEQAIADSLTRTRLEEQGPRQASLYSWERSATEMVEVYETVARG
jgi:glycosyltransferase involved in cell wall biosynthesis